MPDAPFREPLLAGSTTFHPPTADVPSAQLMPFPVRLPRLRAALPKAGDTVPGMGPSAARRVRRSCRRARTRPQVGELLQVDRCARAWDYMRVDRGRGLASLGSAGVLGADCRTVPEKRMKQFAGRTRRDGCGSNRMRTEQHAHMIT